MMIRICLEIIKMRLESSDYEVITAINEADAITAVREQMFDLAVHRPASWPPEWHNPYGKASSA